MEYVLWRATDPALATVGGGADQLPGRRLRGRGGGHPAGHARRAGPDAQRGAAVGAPIRGRAGAGLCHAGHVAGVGGERLRGRAEAGVGL